MVKCKITKASVGERMGWVGHNSYPAFPYQLSVHCEAYIVQKK